VTINSKKRDIISVLSNYLNSYAQYIFVQGIHNKIDRGSIDLIKILIMYQIKLSYSIMEFVSNQQKIVSELKYRVDMLFIDFDDTLVDYKTCQDEGLNLLMNHYGIDASDYPNIFDKYHNINNQLWPELEKGNKTIPQIREERFDILKRTVPFDDHPIELDKKYLEFFVQSTKMSHTEFAMLKKLKKIGFKIVITTNGIREVQRDRIKRIGINDIIDGVITSEDVGQAKPSPKMYEVSLQNYNLTSDEAFVIGDSLSSDILGANNAKILSCWLNYDKTYSTFNIKPKPDMICKDFEAICSFIIKLKLG
jgi:YjjG family noncanonical pyrimidine nucleotidase